MKRYSRPAAARSFFQQVYQLVKQIPPGQVATYGQIAAMLGDPRGARTVGWAMRAVPEGSGVPWHRVLNARGKISLFSFEGGDLQRYLLEQEGVVFDGTGKVDLGVYGWTGPTA
jgi:methylated-DNA-protein-cysteine methyltransferase-like protein